MCEGIIVVHREHIRVNMVGKPTQGPSCTFTGCMKHGATKPTRRQPVKKRRSVRFDLKQNEEIPDCRNLTIGEQKKLWFSNREYSAMGKSTLSMARKMRYSPALEKAFVACLGATIADTDIRNLLSLEERHEIAMWLQADNSSYPLGLEKFDHENTMYETKEELKHDAMGAVLALQEEEEVAEEGEGDDHEDDECGDCFESSTEQAIADDDDNNNGEMLESMRQASQMFSHPHCLFAQCLADANALAVTIATAAEEKDEKRAAASTKASKRKSHDVSWSATSLLKKVSSFRNRSKRNGAAAA